ncbi:cobyrinate a,c-diamide synthase [bacterium]|nr:MAG: cobyrinate a,c-diamide synthase [bacterium]
MDSAVLISASGTGQGKTLVATALCAALSRSGRTVQAYKVGPDYIDASFYRRVCGRPAYNVDLWLDGEAGVQRHVRHTRGGCDALVFEGMMGLFDGDDEGQTSTAHIAMLLDLPVILVLDLWTCSQTAAAVALGCFHYDSRLRPAGVILNRAGGESHERAVRRSCAQAGIRVLATVPYDAAFDAGERHLGLDPRAVEARAKAVERLAEHLAAQLPLDELFPAGSGTQVDSAAPVRSAGSPVLIAVAHDDAFWFTYAETYAALRAAGAEPVGFSPLADRTLPAGARGLWIGGGYPEQHAKALEANASMRQAIADAIAAGLPTYAECGGLMYLAERLKTSDGCYAMAGVLRGATSMVQPRLRIGYRHARAVAETPLDPAGSTLRGYEFHYASNRLHEAPAYAFDKGGHDGAHRPNLLAAFLHRHFLPGDAAITRFVAACERGTRQTLADS